MLQEGKIKGWSSKDDTITVRGDDIHALEIDYVVTDELYSFVEDDDYWIKNHGKYKLQISENYRDLHVRAGRVIQNEEGTYDVYVHECILHPTQKWLEWLEDCVPE